MVRARAGVEQRGRVVQAEQRHQQGHDRLEKQLEATRTELRTGIAAADECAVRVSHLSLQHRRVGSSPHDVSMTRSTGSLVARQHCKFLVTRYDQSRTMDIIHGLG